MHPKTSIDDQDELSSLLQVPLVVRLFWARVLSCQSLPAQFSVLMFQHLVAPLQSCSGWEPRSLEWGRSCEPLSLSFLHLNRLLGTFRLLLKHGSAAIVQVVLVDSHTV